MSSPSPYSRTPQVDPTGSRRRDGDGDLSASRHDPATLYNQHAQAVARWAARLAGPGLDIEDIVHEVFLVAFRRLGEFRGDAKVTTWLYEITVRIVQDRRRSQRRWRWLSGGGTAAAGRRDAGAGDELAMVAANQPSPLDLLERKEASASLYMVLDGLAEKYRTTIILFELEGMSGQEVATITGTSLSNVWIRLLRGRREFLKRLLAREAKGKAPT